LGNDFIFRLQESHTAKIKLCSESMHAIDSIRKQQHISQETLAARMGKKREAISRLFSADDSNPTLDTLIELLSALQLTADITLRQTREGEGPIKVTTE
jgi:transcriptional regulator with XRE-family HTH domain